MKLLNKNEVSVRSVGSRLNKTRKNPINIKTAIIGCGRIAWKLEKDPLREKPCTHLGAISSFPEFSILWASDPNPENLKGIQKKYKISKSACFQNSDQILEKWRKNKELIPDLLVIASPTDSHFPLLNKAIELEIPLVIAEKPLALNLKEAGEIISRARNKKIRILTNHERRYSARYIQMFDTIDRGEIGSIESIRGTVTSNVSRLINDKQAEILPSVAISAQQTSCQLNHQKLMKRLSQTGGILLHDGTHLVDLVQKVAGPITKVQAQGRFYPWGLEKWISVNLFTDNGIYIQLDFSGMRDYFQFELDVWGTSGRINIGNGFEKYYYAKQSPFYKGFKSLTRIKSRRVTKGNLHSPFHNLYADALNFFRSGQKNSYTFPSDIFESYKTMIIIDAIISSAKKSGKLIKIKYDRK